MKDVAEKLLNHGAEEVIVKKHLEAVLKSGKKLMVKFGIDPTAPDLHLGHTVPLRKLRQFQDAGHTAVLIIGDFTAMIGDPSGREGARPPLTEKEVKLNMKKYLKLAGKVIDVKKAKVHYNSKWFRKKPDIILELARRISLQRGLERDDFQKRLSQNQEITYLEAFYPLMQGYDSVMVKADLEIGGADQKFNLLMGRRVQRAFDMPEQDILTVSLLEGTDGVKKMSKSYDNYIALNAEPDDMFGKIMRIPDNLIDKYYLLLTDSDLLVEALAKTGPREAKLELARIIVSMYHGLKAAAKAKEEFIRVFSRHEKPTEVTSLKLQVSSCKLVNLLVETKLAPSKSEARRLIERGAVKIDDQKKTDPQEVIKIKSGMILQVGKRQYLRLE